MTAELDASLLGGKPAGDIVVYHEGVPLRPCGVAPPAPACAVSVTAQPDGDVVVAARATFLSDWRFGTPEPDGVGLFDPATGRWYLRRTGGGAPVVFSFGNPGDVPFAGDFDGDRFDTVACTGPPTAGSTSATR